VRVPERLGHLLAQRRPEPLARLGRVLVPHPVRLLVDAVALHTLRHARGGQRLAVDGVHLRRDHVVLEREAPLRHEGLAGCGGAREQQDFQ
jgi:hypothetical protein